MIRERTHEERVATMLRERDHYAEEVERHAAGFPVYELPEFVRARFPDLNLADPATWPEPDRCTDGRPYGFSSYSFGGFRTETETEDRWRRYLRALDADARATADGTRRPRLSHIERGCRNRWKHEDSRLCGTHDRPWRDGVENARKRLRRNARELEHLDLARQLAAHGIVADAQSDSVRLQADAVRDLLRILDEAVRRAGGTITSAVQIAEEVWPDQGPTPEPPL